MHDRLHRTGGSHSVGVSPGDTLGADYDNGVGAGATGPVCPSPTTEVQVFFAAAVFPEHEEENLDAALRFHIGHLVGTGLVSGGAGAVGRRWCRARVGR